MKKDIKNVLICGLGAVGTVYAVKIFESSLVNNDIKLKILLDKNRIKKYQNSPTLYNSKEYLFDFVTSDESEFKADLIMIATKNSGLKQAINDICNFVTDDTIILSLLNGVQSEDLVSREYGKNKVLYSFYIGHTSTRNGRSVTHDGVNKLVFGEKNNEHHSENVKRLIEFLKKTEINHEVPDDMDYARWWKFLVNVGYNQASALLNATYGDFQNLQNVNDIAVKLMEETVEIAKAEGVKNTENLIPEVLDVISKMLPDTKTSMLQDVLAKRKTEVDIFAGYVCELGQKHGIKTPYNDMFLRLISAIDEINCKVEN